MFAMRCLSRIENTFRLHRWLCLRQQLAGLHLGFFKDHSSHMEFMFVRWILDIISWNGNSCAQLLREEIPDVEWIKDGLWDVQITFARVLFSFCVFILIFHRIECRRGGMHPWSPNQSPRSRYFLPLTYGLQCRRPLYRMSLPQEAIDVFNPIASIKILFARSHLS